RTHKHTHTHTHTLTHTHNCIQTHTHTNTHTHTHTCIQTHTHISAEHLKNASYRLSLLLAMCLTGIMVDGVLPTSIMSVLLVPVLKNKAGKLNSIDNYRPIALASILSKVFERILLMKLEM